MDHQNKKMGRKPGRDSGYSPSSQKWFKNNKQTITMQSKYSLVYPYMLQYLKNSKFKNLHENYIMDLIGSLNSKEIIIVEGIYDHIENICKQSDIPFTLIRMQNIITYDFVENTILFCNCTSEYPSDVTTKIRELMDSNIINTLVTTDWCGTNVLKGVLGEENVTKTGTTGDCHCVEVSCTEYNMTFAKKPVSWWLESSSYIVDIRGSTPFMTATEDMNYTSNIEGINPIKRPNLSFKKYLDSGAQIIHFTSHLELQKKHESDKYNGITIKQFIENELELIYNTDISTKISVSEFHSIFTSLIALMGVFADHYIKSPLPEVPTVSEEREIDYKKLIFIHGLTSLNQQIDTQRIELDVKVQEMCNKVNDLDYILEIAHKLRFKYNLNDFPMILVKWCILNNSKFPECKRSILRQFFKTKFKLTIRDFIILYEKCRTELNIPKILQKIFTDRVNDFSPEDFRRFQGSPRYSTKYPISPRNCLKQIVRVSHPKPTSAINMFLKSKKDEVGKSIGLPMVESVITLKSSGEEPIIYLPRLIAEGKLSFIQMFKSLNDLLTCDLETQSWVIQELHNVEKIKRSKVMISGYLNAIKEHTDDRIISGIDNAFKIMTSQYIPDVMNDNIGIYIDGTSSMKINNLLAKAMAIAYGIVHKFPNTKIKLINDRIDDITIDNLKICTSDFRTTIAITHTPDVEKFNHIIWISDNSSYVNMFKGEDHTLTYIDLTGQMYYDPEVIYMPGSEYINLELINGY